MNAMWDKALKAARSARTLQTDGDHEGAINRGYYAMFSAARAALRHVDPKLDNAKTHGTVIRRFGLHIVVGKGLDPELGGLLPETEDVRLAADYEDEPIGPKTVIFVLDDMGRFLAAIAGVIGVGKP